MTKQAPLPIKVHSMTAVHSTVRDELFFTGGLRGVATPEGWTIGPIWVSEQMGSIETVQNEQIHAFCREFGVELIGAQEVIDDGSIRQRLWHPLMGDSRITPPPADQWGAIATGAHRARDSAYADLAQAISASFRAAGLQLRNIADEYTRQLEGALVRNEKPGNPFSNAAVIDLHLACHSLVAELGSARDYLAKVAAIRAGAPERIDALNRLIDWVAKPANGTARADPVVAALVAAADPMGGDAWLDVISQFRNLFLHRQPLGAQRDADLLVIHERSTRQAICRTISLEIEERPGSATKIDALKHFRQLHNKLCRIGHLASTLAKHPPLTLQLVMEDAADEEAR